MERARARFEPPGLLERPCALALGRCRDHTMRCTSGRPRLAVAEWQGLSERLRPAAGGSKGPEVACGSAGRRWRALGSR